MPIWNNFSILQLTGEPASACCRDHWCCRTVRSPSTWWTRGWCCCWGRCWHPELLMMIQDLRDCWDQTNQLLYRPWSRRDGSSRIKFKTKWSYFGLILSWLFSVITLAPSSHLTLFSRQIIINQQWNRVENIFKTNKVVTEWHRVNGK